MVWKVEVVEAIAKTKRIHNMRERENHLICRPLFSTQQYALRVYNNVYMSKQL